MGGAVFEAKYDGTRSDWGRLVAFEPGVKLALTWHPGNNADPEALVTMEFAQVSTTHTDVTLPRICQRHDMSGALFDAREGALPPLCLPISWAGKFTPRVFGAR